MIINKQEVVYALSTGPKINNLG